MPPVPGRFFSSIACGTYYTVAKLHPFSPPTVVRSVPSFFKPIKNIKKNFEWLCLERTTSPLILLSIWRGDGALVQCHAFCSTISTIGHIQTVCRYVPFFKSIKNIKEILSRYA